MKEDSLAMYAYPTGAAWKDGARASGHPMAEDIKLGP
jgi:hypothetical protein